MNYLIIKSKSKFLSSIESKKNMQKNIIWASSYYNNKK